MRRDGGARRVGGGADVAIAGGFWRLGFRYARLVQCLHDGRRSDRDRPRGGRPGVAAEPRGSARTDRSRVEQRLRLI